MSEYVQVGPFLTEKKHKTNRWESWRSGDEAEDFAAESIVAGVENFV